MESNAAHSPPGAPRRAEAWRILSPSALSRKAARDSSGNVLVMFAGMAVGLVLLVGAGVDYTRAVQFKASLQSLADASALAGASAYVSSTTGDTGISVATSYWNAGLSRLPSNSGVGTPNITTSSDASGYYVQVSVPASTIKTTFLSLIMNSIGVVVSAKAKDPIVSAGVDLSGWTSRAYDGNTMYWYDVPSDGSLPTFDTAHANQSGYNTAFHPFYTNIVNYTGAPLSTSFSIAAAQQIGFALVNVTGGSCPNSGCSPMTNYGPNGYGGSFNSVHVFFSQLNPPANSTYGYQPGPTLNGSRCNASLITAVVDPNNPYQTDPSAGAGVCQPAAANSVAAPSCARLGTTSYRYFWNDMGGGRDDFDYNDAVYNFSCSTNGSPNTGVILTD